MLLTKRLALILLAAAAVFACCTLDRRESALISAKRQFRQLAAEGVLARTAAQERSFIQRVLAMAGPRDGMDLRIEFEAFDTDRNRLLGDKEHRRGPYILVFSVKDVGASGQVSPLPVSSLAVQENWATLGVRAEEGASSRPAGGQQPPPLR